MERNLTKLHRKWIGKGPVDLAHIRSVILREKRAAERGAIKVSRSLLTEIRAELAYVSREINARAALAGSR